MSRIDELSHSELADAIELALDFFFGFDQDDRTVAELVTALREEAKIAESNHDGT